MNCLLAIACLFDPSNLYISGATFTPVSPHQKNEGAWCDTRWCRGPLGELQIGFRADLAPGVKIDLGLRHDSYLMENDRGAEYAFLSLEWRPFGGRP